MKRDNASVTYKLRDGTVFFSWNEIKDTVDFNALLTPLAKKLLYEILTLEPKQAIRTVQNCGSDLYRSDS